jgi:hypothetical protein
MKAGQSFLTRDHDFLAYICFGVFELHLTKGAQKRHKK